MKKMYVINLDRSRIIILTGLVLAIFGFTFLLGSRFSGMQAGEQNTFLNPQPDTGQNSTFLADEAEDRELEALVAGNPQAPAPGNQLPVEDEKLFEENQIPIAGDPFLNPAPAPKESPKALVQPDSSQKTVAQNPEKLKKPESSKISPAQKYYTIQLGAYVHEKDAIAFCKKLQKEGLKEARVDRGIRFYFVRAGRFRNKDDVEFLYKKIHDTMKLEAIVVLR